MRSNVFIVASLLLGFSLAGCSKATAPLAETGETVEAETVAASKPDSKLVTLHIDGFKKSKSGGT